MKFGICSEIFNEWNDFQRTCDFVKDVGYDGIEIAPSSFVQDVKDFTLPMRDDVVKQAQDVGLDIVGLHWILVGPQGVHLTSPDDAVRARTAQYLIDLAHLCGDLGGKIMVFGSPKQRNLMDGVSYEEAFDFARGVVERALPACEERGVTLLMEQLAPAETNFCDTVERTVALIDAVNHPNFKLILDTKAMVDEPEGRPALIRKYAPYLRHYHANDPNLHGPGWGEVPFEPIFEALQNIGFDRYVSVEVFNFEPGPVAIAGRSFEYMQACLERAKT
jgi:sugar phosphate isomerase/epimerase